jgi:hypothetical protein
MPKNPADLDLYVGAGDGNRTRTISLGIRPIGAPDRPDLAIRCTASDRHRPCDTRVNGPPMARGPMSLKLNTGIDDRACWLAVRAPDDEIPEPFYGEARLPARISVMAPTGPMRTTVDLETLSRSAASLRISRRPRGHALPSARSQRSRFRMPAS